MDVAAFTDTYLPTVNGVSYTIAEWKGVWDDEYGSMDVFCPDADETPEDDGTMAARSVRFPFYNDFRVGLPVFPSFRVGTYRYDIVHAHTPFTIGLSGLRYAKRSETPFVLSYHTPVEEYATYLPLEGVMKRVARRHQNMMFRAADHIITPTQYVKEKIRARTRTPITVLGNGIDTTRFRPTGRTIPKIKEKLHSDRPTVGYTGRLGKEKNIELILDSLGDEDVNIVIGGDGPAKKQLEEQAASCNATVCFPGFIDHNVLPALYSLFDVFAFPSPVETQGKVALEAIACGTPVVGINQGALPETIDSGATGEVVSERRFGDTVLDVCKDASYYRSNCLAAREENDIDTAVEDLHKLYRTLL